jgi:hypothetical protein
VRNAVDLAHAFGIAQPRVAVLAAVETVNPQMPATLDAAAAVQDGRPRPDPGARSSTGRSRSTTRCRPAAARTKGIVSEVAGAADILLVPDLESGNMLAKQLVLPRRRGQRRHRARRAGAHRADEPRGHARVAHRLVRGRAGRGARRAVRSPPHAGMEAAGARPLQALTAGAARR